MIADESQLRSPRVTVIGGGLAGISAAAAAAEHGCRVELFEQSAHLGGRAGSFLDPHGGQLVDQCQHLALGCCTELLDLCRRLGVIDCFQRERTLHFFAPDGTRSDLAAVRWLPAPLHLLPGLLRQKYLSLSERWQIVRALRQLTRQPHAGDCPKFRPSSPRETPKMGLSSSLPHAGDCPNFRPSSPRETPKMGLSPSPGSVPEETVGDWLRRMGQSPRAIARFWSPVIVSALAETPDRASLAAARKVFVDGFLSSRHAYELLLPRLPLQTLIDDRMGRWLSDHGVTIHRRARVKQLAGDSQGVRELLWADGTRQSVDCAIVAVPWRSIRALLSADIWTAVPALSGVEHIEPAAITAVHLWYDRPLDAPPHAILLERLSQWIFGTYPAHSVCRCDRHTECAGYIETGYHYQIVISGSHALAGRDRNQILAEVCRDLQSIWPAAREAQLRHHRVIVQPAAVFAMAPGLERFRPPQATPVKNLFLAGDWTSTGWPATMEGAVRSGSLAAEALAIWSTKARRRFP